MYGVCQTRVSFYLLIDNPVSDCELRSTDELFSIAFFLFLTLSLNRLPSCPYLTVTCAEDARDARLKMKMGRPSDLNLYSGARDSASTYAYSVKRNSETIAVFV